MSPQQPHNKQKPIENPHEVGFIEQRWRMLKAGVMGVGSYLLKPKTYLMAIGFGIAFAALATFTPLEMVAVPELSKAAMASGEFFKGLAAYVGKMVVMGSLFHMGIDSYKESKCCNKETKQAHEIQQHRGEGRGPSQEQAMYHPHNYRLDEEQKIESPATPFADRLAQERNHQSTQSHGRC